MRELSPQRAKMDGGTSITDGGDEMGLNGQEGAKRYALGLEQT